MRDKNYSVLMSVYEKEEPQYFRESIESMVNQTLPPEEIVIVKDGALTRQLEEIINDFTKRHPKLFTIVPLKQNVSLGKDLNYVLEIDRKEIVLRISLDIK